MSIYLLEVGTEELPYKFIPQAIEQLNNTFTNFLNENKVNFSQIKVYATPRRLALVIDGLDPKTADEEKIIKGPIASAAFDENGNLTRAGEGFAVKNNLSKTDLYVQDNYVYAKVLTKGKSISELLKDNVPSLFMKLQGAHFMRWGYNNEKFSRPIKWIVSLLDDQEVKIKIIDKESTRYTRGHRFASQNILINTPDEYLNALRKEYVIADQNERKEIIIQKAKEAAATIGAEPYYTEDLLEEVTFITEYPVPAICEFDPEYLNIPEEVTVTVMAVHQRYFALYKNGKLTNKFITMTNYIGNEFENIKAGNLRVIKARLDDAVFFFKEDTKKPLCEYVENLKGVTFQKGMGSMYDKTQRLIHISKAIAADLGIESTNIERCALLCKADLTTNLVFEFTELQGFIGADYAKVSGENEKVAQGIKEHYYPLNAESETAVGIEGQIVGIADKLDTVCAVFAAGKKPTGSSDPLGVRRAALGVIKTIIDAKLKIDIDKYIKLALELLPVQKDCAQEVNEFFVQRMIILLNDKYNKNILEACAAKNPLTDITDYLKRVQTVKSMDYPQLLENANRVIRILKDSTATEINTDLFVENAEKELYNAIVNVSETDNYDEYLAKLDGINPEVSKFFDDVLVMDKDEKIKNNRIALLTLLKKKYDHLTDFSKI